MSHNPRSTVGTVTEIQIIADYYLQILERCIAVTGKPVRKQSTQDMLNEVKEWHKGKPILVMAPIIKKQKGEFHMLFNDLRKQGFVRVRVDGELKRLEDCHRLEKYKQHTIELVIDRVKNDSDQHSRLFEAIELSAKQSDGLVLVEEQESSESMVLSEHFVSDDYQFNITELTTIIFI